LVEGCCEGYFYYTPTWRRTPGPPKVKGLGTRLPYPIDYVTRTGNNLRAPIVIIDFSTAHHFLARIPALLIEVVSKNEPEVDSP
jgi:hypothetical protein